MTTDTAWNRVTEKGSPHCPCLSCNHFALSKVWSRYTNAFNANNARVNFYHNHQSWLRLDLGLKLLFVFINFLWVPSLLPEGCTQPSNLCPSGYTYIILHHMKQFPQVFLAFSSIMLAIFTYFHYRTALALSRHTGILFNHVQSNPFSVLSARSGRWNEWNGRTRRTPNSCHPDNIWQLTMQYNSHNGADPGTSTLSPPDNTLFWLSVYPGNIARSSSCQYTHLVKRDNWLANLDKSCTFCWNNFSPNHCIQHSQHSQHSTSKPSKPVYFLPPKYMSNLDKNPNIQNHLRRCMPSCIDM